MADIIRLHNRIIKPRWEWRPRINANHPLNVGLVDLWLFNEVGGSKTYNLSNKGNHGTINGSVWKPGKFGQALDFDGTDDYVNIPDADDTKYIGPLTICVWAKIDTGSAYRAFVDKHLTNGATNNPFDFRTNNAATPLLRFVRANTNYREFSGPAVTLGVWKFYCVTVSSGLVETVPIFYIDAIPTTGSLVFGTVTGAVTGSGAAIRIGLRAATAVKMDGRIDNVRIYRRALSMQEIRWLYQEPFAGIDIPIFKDYWHEAAAGGGNPWYYYAQQ